MSAIDRVKRGWRTTAMSRVLYVSVLAAVCLTFSPAAGVTVRAVGQKGDANPRAVAVAAFDARVKAYHELRRKAAATVPVLGQTPDASAILAHERALADAIRGLRPHAKPGELFGADMTPLIVDVIRKDWKARKPVDRAALLAEMPQPFVPRVNMNYPPSQPFMTFPARLLAQLHQLPDDLEYRFVGRHLILRDVTANLIVDVVRNVLLG